MKISLVVLSAGKAAGKALPITAAQFIIGRDPECNLRPASAMISKRHCAVLVKNGQVFLRDFDSTNGTFVNEEAVKGEVPLKDGDMIKVGPLSFKVVIEASAATPKPPTKTTPPPPANDISDDDAAAAALLAFEDDGQVSVTNSDTGAEVPGGSTVMDMPAFAGKEGEQAAKPDDKKSTANKNHATGAAQDAAKAILDAFKKEKGVSESFLQWAERIGAPKLKELVEPFITVPAYDQDPKMYEDLGDAGHPFKLQMGKGECAA